MEVTAMETEILSLKEVDSTNTYAKDHFPELADGTLVSAEYQTAGRGRLGRKWISPPGTNLTATFVMKQLTDPFGATCAVSLAVLDLLRSIAPEADFFIKWPNDIYCGDAKIAGLLSEGVISGGKIGGMVTGMGINVNLTETDLASIDQAATSLYFLLKRKTDVTFLLSELAKSLNACYITYSKSPELIFERWKEENRLRGREILFDTPDGQRIRGVLTQILEDGAIEVRTDDQDLLTFRCGDVRIVKGSWLNKKQNALK